LQATTRHFVQFISSSLPHSGFLLSERELMFTFAICRRKSVWLSVVCL